MVIKYLVTFKDGVLSIEIPKSVRTTEKDIRENWMKKSSM